MDLWNNPRNRLLCAEPLEHRRLLSGAAPADAAEGDEDSGDREIETSDLPRQVIDALQARFPDVELLEAELTDEDGDALYEVGAELDGQIFDVTLTATGEVIGIEGESPPSEVPTDPPAAEAAPEVVPSASTAPVDDGIEVVEVETASDGDDGSVDISLARLPARVVAGFLAQFPGAKITAAERGVDDDSGEREFDIAAVFNGQEFDATLTPEGEVVETEQPLASTDLPGEAIEWVRRNFAAEVEEAAFVTEDGQQLYELLIPLPGGGATEVKLHIPGAPPPALVPELAAADAGDAAPVLTSPDAAAAESAGAITVETNSEPRLEAQTAGRAGAESPVEVTAKPAATAEEAPRQPSEVVGADEADAATETAAGVEPTEGATPSAEEDFAVAEALRALIGGSAGPLLVPEMMGMLANALPLDVAAVERGLADLLDELDALAETFVSEAGTDEGPWRLALVAALLAGAQLLLLDSRRRGAGPTLVFNAAGASWSWVLGTATTERRRRRRLVPGTPGEAVQPESRAEQ